MSELVPRHRYTFEEYLELEEIASVRQEFYDGEIYAMAGGTPEHAAMTAAITSALGAQIQGSACRVYTPICVCVYLLPALQHTQT